MLSARLIGGIGALLALFVTVLIAFNGSAQPVVTVTGVPIGSIAPTKVCAGSYITLTPPPGQQFPLKRRDLTVYFAPCAVEGHVTSWSQPAIVVEVPEYATSGGIFIASAAAVQKAMANARRETAGQRGACLAAADELGGMALDGGLGGLGGGGFVVGRDPRYTDPVPIDGTRIAARSPKVLPAPSGKTSFKVQALPRVRRARWRAVHVGHALSNDIAKPRGRAIGAMVQYARNSEGVTPC